MIRLAEDSSGRGLVRLTRSAFIGSVDQPTNTDESENSLVIGVGAVGPGRSALLRDQPFSARLARMYSSA